MTVYFITVKGRTDAPVKIGMTADLDQRLSGLQTSHHEELEVVASLAGGRETESYLHEALAASHIRGEWFARTFDVDAAIARAIAAGAGSLPISDPGIAVRSRRGSEQDADLAKSICRSVASTVLPNHDMEARVRWLHRKLSRICEGVSYRRTRALYQGEVQRVDYFEMSALMDIQADLKRHCADRSMAATGPILIDYMAEAGTPLSPRARDLSEKFIAQAVERLRADREEWGFRLPDGDAR